MVADDDDVQLLVALLASLLLVTVGLLGAGVLTILVADRSPTQQEVDTLTIGAVAVALLSRLLPNSPWVD